MAYSLPDYINDDISIFESDDLSSVYTNDQKTEIPPQGKEPVFRETESNKIKNKMSTNRGNNSTEIKMEDDQPSSSSSSSSSSNSKQSVENVSPDEENSQMSEDDNYSIPLYLFDEKIPPISAAVLEENAQSSSSIVKNKKAYPKSFTEFLNQDPFTFPKASSSSSPSEKRTKENPKRKIAERDDDDLNDHNYNNNYFKNINIIINYGNPSKENLQTMITYFLIEYVENFKYFFENHTLENLRIKIAEEKDFDKQFAFFFGGDEMGVGGGGGGDGGGGIIKNKKQFLEYMKKNVFTFAKDTTSFIKSRLIKTTSSCDFLSNDILTRLQFIIFMTLKRIDETCANLLTETHYENFLTNIRGTIFSVVTFLFNLKKINNQIETLFNSTRYLNFGNKEPSFTYLFASMNYFQNEFVQREEEEQQERRRRLPTILSTNNEEIYREIDENCDAINSLFDPAIAAASPISENCVIKSPLDLKLFSIYEDNNNNNNHHKKKRKSRKSRVTAAAAAAAARSPPPLFNFNREINNNKTEVMRSSSSSSSSSLVVKEKKLYLNIVENKLIACKKQNQECRELLLTLNLIKIYVNYLIEATLKHVEERADFINCGGLNILVERSRAEILYLQNFISEMRKYIFNRKGGAGAGAAAAAAAPCCEIYYYNSHSPRQLNNTNDPEKNIKEDKTNIEVITNEGNIPNNASANTNEQQQLAYYNNNNNNKNNQFGNNNSNSTLYHQKDYNTNSYYTNYNNGRGYYYGRRNEMRDFVKNYRYRNRYGNYGGGG
uniref:Uncharacterized protein n=1 Tax=Armadillidium vulgare clopovirus TaxID=2984284 RepID=A0A9C7CEM3_9VIRU|nr:MAG: hypothetical protein [Armadillidium vulgare clopovirus]